MQSVCELPPLRETALTDIQAQIIRLGLNTQEQGAQMVSKTGRPQSWLIDLRRVFLRRDTLGQIAALFWSLYRDKERFQIAGMETAAIPLLTALVLHAPKDRADVNAFIVRKERKTSGLCRAIEGVVTGDPIVLVDDVINSGSSAEKARSIIGQHGHRVRSLFAVIDYRSRNGLRWRDENQVEVSSLFTLEDFNLSLTSDTPPPRQRYRELWRTEVPGAAPFNVVPKSAPVLSGNRLYRGSDAGKMHAFDADTGTLVWEYHVKAAGRKGIMSIPALHEGRVYFGAFNGAIYCLDAVDGREIWSHSYGEWVGSSPIVVPRHRLVYFGIEYARPWAQGSIGAFDLDTGARVWEHLIRGLQHGSPAYWQGGDLVLWGTADYDMAALDARTGNIVWTFQTRRSVKYAAAIDEQRSLVAFASFDTSIYVLDLRTGEKLGEWQTDEICYTTPLIVGNRLFCGSGDKHLYVIDLEQMKLVEKIDMSARVYCSPRLIAGRVVVGTCGGTVLELDPDTLEIQGRLQLPDAVTNAVEATADGRRIFVSTYMNHLYAFERLGIPALERVTGNADNVSEVQTLAPSATPAAPEVATQLKNFRLIAVGCEIGALRQEILSQADMWTVNTTRQQTVLVQRETESIFLRGARRPQDSSILTEDVHESGLTAQAGHYPVTMRFVEEFSRQRNATLSRVLLARLKPKAQVYRHVDSGEYYRIRDRYHLVICSAAGSEMISGDEEVVMREGELWWFDNKQLHEAFNPSAEGRIHLIFDLLPNDSLAAAAAGQR